MADLDRPNLGLRVYTEIEAKQTEIDTKYWRQLRELQVFIGADTLEFGFLNPQQPPPKLPMYVLSVLADYAVELFTVESNSYPRDPRLKNDLENLGMRVRRRVMDAVTLLESNGLNSLRYHNVKISDMSAAIDEALRRPAEDRLRLQSVPEGASSTLDAKEEPSSPRQRIERFILRMAASGTKVKRKDIWRAAGYKNPTEFERFQRGDARNKSAISNFNRVLKMKPQDFLELLSKRD